MALATLKTPDASADPWKSDKTSWQYVAIPAENAIGEVHADISISGPNQYHNFKHGETYLVPPIYAETIKERLRAYMGSRIRVYSPSRDLKAVTDQGKSGVGSAQLGASVTPSDPSQVATQ